jgi:hypothetical protein
MYSVLDSDSAGVPNFFPGETGRFHLDQMGKYVNPRLFNSLLKQARAYERHVQ